MDRRSHLATMAAQIASGITAHACTHYPPLDDGKDVARVSVALAKAILDEIDRVEPSPEHKRPARTGYRSEDGVYHPSPDITMEYLRHREVCAACRSERP